MRARAATRFVGGAGLLVAGAMGSPREARGADARPSGVTLTVDPCAGVPAPFVERVVAAELSGEADRGATGAPPTPTDVRVTCQGGAVVVTASTASGKPVVRTIDLEREEPPARPRVLSVAIAELVGAARAKPPPPPPEPPPPPTPPPATEPATPAPTPPPRGGPWSVGAAGIARGFASVTTLGARMTAAYVSRAHLGLRADVDGAMGRARVDLGAVDARIASAGAQAIVSARWSRARVGFEGGLGARVGVASLEGRPDARP
jgi:hypothetical protein